MPNDDLERLIHESLEQLGWSADASQVAQRVKRLDFGLPLEDEFSVVCGWLGKCKLIHKLDQSQYPEGSSALIQAPDLLAVFENNGKDIPVLIEVKSSWKNTLSFRPDYKERLQKYADTVKLPLLVAWRTRWDIWALFPLSNLRKAQINYNINFENALCNSLLGMLAGDFSYTVKSGAGIHISCKKQRFVESEQGGEPQHWEVVIDDVYYTNGKSDTVRDLSPIAQSIFYSWSLEESQEDIGSHILIHSVAKDTSALFAHMAITRLLKFKLPIGEENIHWRSFVSGKDSVSEFKEFRSGVLENMRHGIVSYVLDPQPQNVPDFLN